MYKFKEYLETFIKIKLFKINPLRDFCDIQNLDEFEKKGVKFPYPYGIIIHDKAIIGENCTIYQNVTIGATSSKKNGTNCCVPTIGNNVTIYANACILGNVKIGDNAVIGAGAIVVSDVKPNTTVVGIPAKVLERDKNEI